MLLCVVGWRFWILIFPYLAKVGMVEKIPVVMMGNLFLEMDCESEAINSVDGNSLRVEIKDVAFLDSFCDWARIWLSISRIG